MLDYQSVLAFTTDCTAASFPSILPGPHTQFFVGGDNFSCRRCTRSGFFLSPFPKITYTSMIPKGCWNFEPDFVAIMILSSLGPIPSLNQPEKDTIRQQFAMENHYVLQLHHL